MSWLDFNKVIGAVLMTALAFMVIGKIGSNLVAPGDHAAPAMEIASAPSQSASKPNKPEPLAPIGPMLASADVSAGEKVAKKCTACHTFDNGGANKVGPNLWNIVGAGKAAKDGFSYSSAMQNAGGAWGYEELNAFLFKPKDFVKGTKMAFAGLKKESDRANLIAYLRSLADSPKPLP